jgi:hypothetical protein
LFSDSWEQSTFSGHHAASSGDVMPQVFFAPTIWIQLKCQPEAPTASYQKSFIAKVCSAHVVLRQQ